MGLIDGLGPGWIMAGALVVAAGWAVIRIIASSRSERSARHREMADRVGMFSWEIDSATAAIVSISGNVEAVLGYKPEELEGRHVGSIVNLDQAREVIRSERALPEESERYAVVHAVHRDGRAVTLEVRLSPRKAGVVRGVSIDISELARATEALRHQAEHDALTGLANRVRIERVVDEALAPPGRGPFALLLVDLDRFKTINDTLGHPVGDRVLQLLAARFTSTLTDLDVSARMGGDEFAFVASDLGEEPADAAVAVGGRVHEIISAPLDVDGLQLSVGASIGVALCPDHGSSYRDLLKNADVAAYKAKADGGGVVLHEGDPDEIDDLGAALVAEVGDALDVSEFELRFLPRFDLTTGQIVSVAGVPLWHHRRHGLLGLQDFAEAMKVSAHRQRFAHEILRQGVAVIAATAAAGHPVPVAVGVSALSVIDPRLPLGVSELLDRWGVPGSLLTIEIPDTGVLDDPRHQRAIADLRATGVLLSIVGFGAGRSDLFRLPHQGLSQVSLDGSVLRRLDDDCIAVGVRAVLDIGDRLGIDVVADAVWHDDDVARLRAVGCRLAQGEAWAPPVHADDVLALVTARAGL